MQNSELTLLLIELSRGQEFITSIGTNRALQIFGCKKSHQAINHPQLFFFLNKFATFVHMFF